MASLSTNSVSSTNSLGNTSLRGFGGMVSGIDRDSIIEAMTLHASNRVTEQQKEITKLEWKQEAYQSVTDQILDLADNYLSYSSGKSLIDPSFFAKSIISVHGLEESTRFVKASGTSELTENISITSVRQLATASAQESNSFQGTLQTDLQDLEKIWTSSALEGTKLVFGTYTPDEGVSSDATFTFASTYKETYTDNNGKTQTRTVTIDYTNKDGLSDEEFYTNLAKQLNGALKDPDKNLRIGEKDISKIMEFAVARNDKGEAVGITLSELENSSVVINKNSTALKALGYEKRGLAEGEEDYEANGIEFGEFKDNQKKTFKESALNTPMAYEYMKGKKLTFNYDGSKKEIELITKEEAEKLEALRGDPNRKKEQMDLMVSNLQKRLNLAYGTGAVEVSLGGNGQLSFSTGKKDSTVSITSGDTDLLNNLGIVNGESTKVNQSGKLTQSALKETLGDLGQYTDADGNLNLSINGVKIKGLTADSTVSEIMSKINNSDAGVKATYSEATGRFMLVSSETGAGREISLDPGLAQKLFGQTNDGKPTGSYVENLGFKEGKNAVISVSYGSEDVLLERSSNTFDLEGMSVTVSGVFGGKFEESVPKEGSFDLDGLTGERIFYTDPTDKTKIATTLDKNTFYYDKNGQMVNYKGNLIKERKDGSGYELIYDKEWKADSAAAVTFTAAADVDGATERVKSFVEDFNKLVKEINTQVTTYPDDSYGVLTDEQKAEMTDSEIEKWEAKAKEGILYGDSAMRSLSMDVQSVMTTLMSSGASYTDLEKIGITYSDDYLDGGTLVFDESKFKSAMESDPELVSNIITGGGDVSKGLATIVDEAFTPYATRYASKNSDGTSKGTYGMLIEIAGTSKKPTTLYDNQIYTQLKTMNETLENLKATLKTQQERYISQFTYMESMINQFNSQSSYLSNISG